MSDIWIQPTVPISTPKRATASQLSETSIHTLVGQATHPPLQSLLIFPIQTFRLLPRHVTSPCPLLCRSRMEQERTATSTSMAQTFRKNLGSTNHLAQFPLWYTTWIQSSSTRTCLFLCCKQLTNHVQMESRFESERCGLYIQA